MASFDEKSRLKIADGFHTRLQDPAFALKNIYLPNGEQVTEPTNTRIEELRVKLWDMKYRSPEYLDAEKWLPLRVHNRINQLVQKYASELEKELPELDLVHDSVEGVEMVMDLVTEAGEAEEEEEREDKFSELKYLLEGDEEEEAELEKQKSENATQLASYRRDLEKRATYVDRVMEKLRLARDKDRDEDREA